MIGALERGGAERQLMTLARGLSARGYAVEIWCYTGASEFDEALRKDGIEVRTSGTSGFFNKRLTVRGWLETSQPDVLHCFMKRASVLGVLSRPRHSHTRVIASDFSTAAYGKRDHVLWTSLAMFYLSDRIVTETAYNKSEMERLAPWLRGRIDVVRNGVDLTRLRSKSTLNAPSDPFRFCVVGSVYHLKNPLRVVQAVKALAALRSDFRVDWYGRRGLGSDEHPSEDYLACMDYIAANDLEEFIQFHGECADIEARYAASDALIHISLQEGMPNAVVEGMAVGLPLIVSNVSDLPMVVSTAQNGFVADEKDTQSVAQAMTALMDKPPQERSAMATRSVQLAKDWFALDRFIDDHEDLYTRAMPVQNERLSA